MEVPLAGDTRNMQISTQRIPVGSSIGAATLIAIVLLGLFLDLPGVRITVMACGAVGLLVAILLIRWRRRTVGTSLHPSLDIDR